MKVYAIINPVAGGGYAEEAWPEIKEEFSGFDLKFDFTDGPGHATELAEKAVINGAEYILCIGGDGTLNEVSQALVKTNSTLVPMPAGTGSDFIKTTNLADLADIKKGIREGKRSSIDAVKVNFEGGSRYFINVMEVGFGASVMERVNSHKKVRGSRSFTSAVLKEVMALKKYDLILEYGNVSDRREVVEIVIANGKYFGGGMLASRDSSLTDGLVDVHIIKYIGRMGLVKRLGSLRDGTYILDPQVSSISLSSLKIRGENIPFEIDGEAIGSLPVELSVEPKSIFVLGKDV